jgi:hypothetical protein
LGFGSTLAGGAGSVTDVAGEDDDPGLDAPDQTQVERGEGPPAPAA